MRAALEAGTCGMVNALAKEYAVKDRRRVRLEPEQPVIAEHLALTV